MFLARLLRIVRTLALGGRVVARWSLSRAGGGSLWPRAAGTFFSRDRPARALVSSMRPGVTDNGYQSEQEPRTYTPWLT